jgi:hypothetical protein
MYFSLQSAIEVIKNYHLKKIKLLKIKQKKKKRREKLKIPEKGSPFTYQPH